MSRSRRPKCRVGRSCGTCGHSRPAPTKRQAAWDRADGRQPADKPVDIKALDEWGGGGHRHRNGRGRNR